MLAHAASSLGNALPGGGSLPIEYLGSETFSTPGSITGTPPANATHVHVRMWGGGASGTGRFSSSSGGFTGGSAAAYAEAFPKITGAIAGTVGTGGAKTTGTATTGNAGTETTLSVNGANVATAAGAASHSSNVSSVATIAAPGTVDAAVQVLFGGVLLLPMAAIGQPGLGKPGAATTGGAGAPASGYGGGAGGTEASPDGQQPGAGGASANSGGNLNGKGGDGRIILDYFRIAT